MDDDDKSTTEQQDTHKKEEQGPFDHLHSKFYTIHNKQPKQQQQQKSAQKIK